MLEAAVKFSISNPGVATVTEDTGLIEAIKPGQATITGKVHIDTIHPNIPSVTGNEWTSYIEPYLQYTVTGNEGTSHMHCTIPSVHCNWE